MKKLIVISLAFLLMFNFAIAQKKKKLKFGKVSKEELLMEFYEADSSANAVILYDKATWSANIEGYERHTIIKILRNEGKKNANIEIPLKGNGVLSYFSVLQTQAHPLTHQHHPKQIAGLFHMLQ